MVRLHAHKQSLLGCWDHFFTKTFHREEIPSDRLLKEDVG